MDNCHIYKIHKNAKDIYDLQNTVSTISSDVSTISSSIDPWLEIFSKNGSDVVIGNNKTKIDFSVIEKDGNPEFFVNGTRFSPFAYADWFSVDTSSGLVIKSPSNELTNYVKIHPNQFLAEYTTGAFYKSQIQQSASNINIDLLLPRATKIDLYPGTITLQADGVKINGITQFEGNAKTTNDFIFGDQNNRKKIDFYVSEVDGLPEFFVNGTRFGTGGSGESFKYADWFSGSGNYGLKIGKSTSTALTAEVIYGGSYTASVGLDSYTKGGQPSLSLKTKGKSTSSLTMGGANSSTELTTGKITFTSDYYENDNNTGFTIKSADYTQIQGAGESGTETGTFLLLSNCEDGKEILLDEDGIQFYIGGNEKLRLTEDEGISTDEEVYINSGILTVKNANSKTALTLDSNKATLNGNKEFAIGAGYQTEQIYGKYVDGADSSLTLCNKHDGNHIYLNRNDITINAMAEDPGDEGSVLIVQTSAVEKLRISERDGITTKCKLTVNGDTTIHGQFLATTGESEIDFGGDLTLNGTNLVVESNATTQINGNFYITHNDDDVVTVNNNKVWLSGQTTIENAKLFVNDEDGENVFSVNPIDGYVRFDTSTIFKDTITLSGANIRVSNDLIIGTDGFKKKIDVYVPVYNNLPELFINGTRYGEFDKIRYEDSLTIESDNWGTTNMFSKEYVVVCDPQYAQKDSQKEDQYLFSATDFSSFVPYNDIYMIYKSYQYKCGKLHVKVILRLGESYDFSNKPYIDYNRAGEKMLCIPMQCLALKKDTAGQTKNIMNAHGVYVTDSYVDTATDAGGGQTYPFDAFFAEDATESWNRSFNYVFANVEKVGKTLPEGDYELTDLTTALLISLNSSAINTFESASNVLDSTKIDVPNIDGNAVELDRKYVLYFDIELPDGYYITDNIKDHVITQSKS